MHLLAYISAAAPSFIEDDLGRILVSAKKYNQAHDVTGILMFHQGQFFQVLEGPKSAVEACFKRIETDPRHRGVIKLYDDVADDRCFTDWSMAAVTLNNCQPMLKAQLINLFELQLHPQYDGLKKNKVVGVFVDTFLSDLHRFSDLLDLP